MLSFTFLLAASLLIQANRQRKNTVCIFKLFYDSLAIRLICLSVARGNISSTIANTNKKERTLRASSFYTEAKERKKNENGKEQRKERRKGAIFRDAPRGKLHCGS